MPQSYGALFGCGLFGLKSFRLFGLLEVSLMSNASTDPWRLKEHEGNARSQSQSTVPECSSCSAMLSIMHPVYILASRPTSATRGISCTPRVQDKIEKSST